MAISMLGEFRKFGAKDKRKRRRRNLLIAGGVLGGGLLLGAKLGADRLLRPVIGKNKPGVKLLGAQNRPLIKTVKKKRDGFVDMDELRQQEFLMLGARLAAGTALGGGLLLARKIQDDRSRKMMSGQQSGRRKPRRK